MNGTLGLGNHRWLWACGTALILGACNPGACLKLPDLTVDAGLPSLHGTEEALQEELVVQGMVNAKQDGASGTSPASNATVSAAVDRDHNGTISGAEKVEVSTDSDGKYRLEMSVTKGETVVITYRQDGMAAQYRTVVAGPKANVRMNITLQELKDLTCTEGTCAPQDRSLSLKGLKAGYSARARTFNPVTEANAFPGDFGDSNGNLLLSGVFSVVELTDENGNAVSQLDAPAELRMRLPKDTWNIVKDITPGNGRIDVPMYAFDEVKGTWVASGTGYLEDEAGATLPETSLAAIRAGTFAGGVVARAVVNHFSSWNVDWPVDTKGCLSGRVLDRDGNPAEGATVLARGVTYNGSSSGVTTGVDGRFCVDVMRSDTAGEDVDQDGVTGETQQVALRVLHRGLIYDMGNVSTPSATGTCAQGNCKDVGDLRISEGTEIIPTVCSLSGTVVDKADQGLEGASIFGFDTGMDGNLYMAACMQEGATCEMSATSGPGGSFTLRPVMLDQLMVFGMSTATVEEDLQRYRLGNQVLTTCPATPVKIILDNGFDSYTLHVTVSGNRIAWTPAVAANTLLVSGSGGMKWTLYATGDTGFLPPVNYGTVPAGAEASSGADGGVPAPLASGDEISVVMGGMGADGYPVMGNGSVSVP